MIGGLSQKRRAGQSAAELAVFGALVIFVIGLILRVSLSMSHSSNIDLRAFRMALRESYRTADGIYSGAKFSAGRNTSSIMVVEDRLTIDPSQKQGTRDRAPFISQAVGTMTHSLLMSIEWTDLDDLPVFDLFVNGQRFPLSTVRLVNKSFKPGFQKVYRGGDGFNGGCNDCFDLSRDGVSIGDDWETALQNSNVELLVDIGEGATPGSLTLRENFAWQWARYNGGYDNQETIKKGLEVDIDNDLKEERIVGPGLVLDYQDGDIDMTVDEGDIKRWEAKNPGKTFRRPGIQSEMEMYSWTYLGGTADDGVDGTYLRNREGKLYGDDGQFVRNETRQDHLDIIERKLFLSNDTGRFCSVGGGGSVCSSYNGSCIPTQWGESEFAKKNGLRTMRNPVERCGDCLSKGNKKYTCMQPEDPHGPTIYIRSRIRDRRKTRWITRTDN